MKLLIKNPPPIVTAGEEISELVSGRIHSIAYVTIPPKNGSRKHYHPWSEEIYYILSGEGTVTIKGTEYYVSAGNTLLIEKEETHQIKNNSDTNDLVFIVTCAPPWTPTNTVYIDD